MPPSITGPIILGSCHTFPKLPSGSRVGLMSSLLDCHTPTFLPSKPGITSEVTFCQK